MREVITLHIGQAGVQIGQSIWQLFCNEHFINLRSQKIQQPSSIIQKNNYEEDLGVLFHQTSKGHYVPRSTFIDMDPTPIDQIKNGKYRDLFNKNHIVSGKQSANTFERGHYSLGRQYADIQLDVLRKMVQRTDNLDGFLISHSVCGGTGSGLGSLLLQRMSVEFGKKFKISFSIYPSKKFSWSVIQPYQAVLATHSLLQYTDATIFLDNQKLYNICQKNMEIQDTNYHNINQLIAQNFSFLTSFSRFKKSSLGMNFSSLLTNSIPYPRIHFLATSICPYINPQKQYQYRFMKTQDITKKVFQKNNFMLEINPQYGKYLSTILMYRGNANHMQALNSFQKLKNQSYNMRYVDWIPTGYKLGICQKPMLSNNPLSNTNLNKKDQNNTFKQISNNSVYMLGNSTSIAQIYSRIDHRFDLMYARRAFVHWYVGNCMQQGQFSQARQDLAALQKDYQEGSIQYWQGQQQDYNQVQF